MTSGVDVAGGVGALVGGKLTIGVDEAVEIGVPVGGTLAIGAGAHAAIAKHTNKTVLNTCQRLFIWPSLLSTRDANLQALVQVRRLMIVSQTSLG